MIPKHVLAWLEEMRRKGVTVRTEAGDTNLTLSRPELESYALVEADGTRLLATLEGCHREAEKLGLVKAGRSVEGVWFKVPHWGRLVAFLRTVGGSK